MATKLTRAERDSLRYQLESSQAECERLREVIEGAAQIFEGYQKLHAEKDPPALEKANFNAEIAATLRAAMQPASAPVREAVAAPQPQIDSESPSA